MATVTGLTAQRMAEIEGASVVDGNVVGNNLVLTKHNGQTIDAGSVRGAPGEGAYIKRVLLPAVKLLTKGPSTELALDGFVPPTGQAFCVGWAPDQRFLTVGHETTPFITTYEFNGIDLVKIPAPNVLPANRVNDISWSKDGSHLAVAHNNGIGFSGLTVYKFNGSTLKKVDDPIESPSGNCLGISWAPDGRSLAVCTDAAPYVYMYAFNKGELSRFEDPAFVPTSAVKKVSWYPDGSIVSFAATSSPYVLNYLFDGVSMVKFDGITALPSSAITDIAWSPDGRYLCCGHNNNTFSISVYGYDDGVFSNPSVSSTSPQPATQSISWAPDSSMITATLNAQEKPKSFMFNSGAIGIYIVGSGTSLTRKMSAWSPDGQFVAYATTESPYVKVHKTFSTYYTDGSYTYAFR